MEINAYLIDYLTFAQDTLGNMLDYAINTCNFQLEEFYSMFLMSHVSVQFGKGNTAYIAGKSGAELAQEVFQVIKNETFPIIPHSSFEKSPEYWCGWALAYYQWKTNRTFKKIQNMIPIEEILCMYKTHHEADITKFVDTMNDLFAKRHKTTYLEQYRTILDLSLEELSKQSEIDLVELKNLEQNIGSINNISSSCLYRIAHVLQCDMLDLMEL